MGVIIGAMQGAIDKSVSKIIIADEQGSIDKQILLGNVAAVQGGIDKKFFPDDPEWVHCTGEILKSSAGGAIMGPASSRALSAQLSYAIRPVTLKYVTTTKRDEGVNATARFEVEVSADGVNYTMLPTQTITIVTDYYNSTVRTFTMDGQTDVKYVKYRIRNIGSYDFSTGTIEGKCTEWWKQG